MLIEFVVAIDYSTKCQVHNRNWKLQDSSDVTTKIIAFELSVYLTILKP